MVLEVLIIGGVVYYFAHKRHEKKKARLAAEAAAANAGNPSNQQYLPTSSRDKGNEADGYSDLPSYGDARRQRPPVYEQTGGALPAYEERGAVVNEKSPLVNVNEQSR
ncbi:uncharacterized protein AB675_4970 [Cyphellophora attinorum]|uniref:Uncharacterized protein n=1 Tax=Cyphellophora attinorum TaxID=1664694 RepID=A0A0N1H3L2_9EURO|nr:uncharacterized protein AB675_4970 [Phialophora attinorum]KPI39497.1 hypothetical protein AB675_4970 [Phialophora attinorum]